MAARIFPSVFPVDNGSSGERKVFNHFKDNAPDSWCILHSFRLPEHKRAVFGEADFVVIAPPHGVFVLEVKSGGVGFDGSDWLYINRNHEVNRKSRGPFEQARDAMFEIKKIISDKTDGELSDRNILYYYGVIFTDEDSFPADLMTEDQMWCLQQNDGRNDYCAFIKSLGKNFREQMQRQGKRPHGELGVSDAAKIARILRPVVEAVPPIKSFIDDTEQDIIQLTEEQLDCLDDIELNPQMVIMGGAGTGKTVIAAEDAKRAAAQGKKVGFFCYNTKLAEKLKETLADFPDIEVTNISRFLMGVSGEKIDMKSMTPAEVNDFFNEGLPMTALSKITGPLFDKLIIDEFQDICSASYLKVLDKILKGGLCDGNFTFYGDFSRQAIFNKTADLALLENYSIFAKKRLSVNCRNTMNVGNELVNITGFEDTKYKLRIQGEKVDFYTWKSKEDEIQKFDKAIDTLLAAEISPADITILSPVSKGSTMLDDSAHAKSIAQYQTSSKKNRIAFSTVQGFKGLENKVIVLIEITTYSDRQLMYVALSRARAKLIVLESAAAKAERETLTAKRAAESSGS